MAEDSPKSGEGNHAPAAEPVESSELRRVFISYASQDAAIANAVVTALERAGISCWIAPRDVTPGALYADGIIRAINDAKALVMVLSASSIGSPHVGKEVERASSKRRPIVTLKVDTATLTTALEYFLSESQWIDWVVEGKETALKKVADAVRRHMAIPSEVHVIGTREPRGRYRNAKLPRTASIIVLVVFVLALTGFAIKRLWLPRQQPERYAAAPAAPAGEGNVVIPPTVVEKSIAVLPFTDMSESRNQEYFADGMAEEVLDRLAKLPGIQVIGRTSSFQFKGRDTDLRTIGNALGAAYVVEGSVRKQGDRLRVTAQLIGARDGLHVWSDTYDRDFKNVFELQDQIASSIVRALQVSVGADLQSRRALNSPAAYDLYLRGRHALDRFDKSGFESAAAYFEQALALDPSSVAAAESLAEAHEFIAEFGFVPPREGYERARASAQRALALNPRSAMAHALLADIHIIYDWDWKAGLDESNIALAIEPRHAYALSTAAESYAAVGRFDEARQWLHSALSVDPLFAGWYVMLGYIEERSGRMADAEAAFRRAIQISPTYSSAPADLGVALVAENRLKEALTQIQLAPSVRARECALPIVYHAMKRKADSDMALKHLIDQSANDSAFAIAEVLAFRGETDKALVWLERAYQQKDTELYVVKGDWPLKNLEGDARFKAFLHKLNIPD
jgi:TolB-like protein